MIQKDPTEPPSDDDVVKHLDEIEQLIHPVEDLVKGFKLPSYLDIN